MNDFFANLFEFFGTAFLGPNGAFSNEMANNGYYTPLACLAVIVPSLVISFIYYYGLNHPRYNRGWIWVIFGFINCVISFIISLLYIDDVMYGLYPNNCPYGNLTEYIPLSIFVSFWSFVFYFVFSFIMKWGSRNCKHSPFI